MANSTSTHWECDACGATDLTNPDREPTGWGQLILMMPLKGGEARGAPVEICRRCVMEWRNRLKITRDE